MAKPQEVATRSNARRRSGKKWPLAGIATTTKLAGTHKMPKLARKANARKVQERRGVMQSGKVAKLEGRGRGNAEGGARGGAATSSE